jgi:hypothetical protein
MAATGQLTQDGMTIAIVTHETSIAHRIIPMGNRDDVPPRRHGRTRLPSMTTHQDR